MDVEWGFMFLGEGFRGLRHPWLEKKMDCFADFPLLHSFNSESHLPSRFGIAHKREGVRIMAKHCCAMFKEPPAPD
ncbi:hypothetical protein PFLUV_G00164090 [Perca fluviatilis]|uniref:Uncharacterized protein n=1 Tax=Perca fluviatilis TaxID=8168 RepID=A0A6A5F0N8_PERFL|nr:hypothetical protein PFLUV_G00164090 [Perca fluviatilis]